MKHWLLACLLVLQPVCAEPPEPTRWEADVAAIEARVKSAAPEPGGTFFVGSSTIRLWKLEKSFPGMRATNVGFGGSQISDCIQYAPRLVLPWKPARIVFYAGSNDVNAGKSPERVARDFEAFSALIHRELPECRIVFLAINPSRARWSQWEKAQEANRLIAEFCRKADPPRLEFVDFGSVFLGSDGLPRKELYLDDALHLNEAGYEAWVKKLGPVLGAR